jgi:hypothetical protein
MRRDYRLPARAVEVSDGCILKLLEKKNLEQTERFINRIRSRKERQVRLAYEKWDIEDERLQPSPPHLKAVAWAIASPGRRRSTRCCAQFIRSHWRGC